MPLRMPAAWYWSIQTVPPPELSTAAVSGRLYSKNLVITIAAALAILALSPASYSQNATKAVLDIQVWVTTETLHEGPYSLQGN
jgi:hypothetical protein